ncbi:hypothetical protein F511_37100 [Dorcoceras hygrometricum]|uniref:Uncharacterized protein n=1 Tax=Dorcoceras hygrometricum TaxID=472368 RepID=A0A2Z7ARX2_9LAMI|nr:hypothetical protein F511_37100 [Dorcoceras hygrometricum]
MAEKIQAAVQMASRTGAEMVIVPARLARKDVFVKRQIRIPLPGAAKEFKNGARDGKYTYTIIKIFIECSEGTLMASRRLAPTNSMSELALQRLNGWIDA